MENTFLSSPWMDYLIECAKIAESCAVPFSDMFGVKTFARCMKIEADTIRDHMKKAEIKPVPIKGVTEAVYHASDIAKVFGRN